MNTALRVPAAPLSTDAEHGEELARALRDALGGLRFGSVEITVHDSRVVQIERREKVRFEERR